MVTLTFASWNRIGEWLRQLQVPVPGGPALGDEGPVLEVPPVIVPAGL